MKFYCVKNLNLKKLFHLILQRNCYLTYSFLNLRDGFVFSVTSQPWITFFHLSSRPPFLILTAIFPFPFRLLLSLTFSMHPELFPPSLYGVYNLLCVLRSARRTETSTWCACVCVGRGWKTGQSWFSVPGILFFYQVRTENITMKFYIALLLTQLLVLWEVRRGERGPLRYHPNHPSISWFWHRNYLSMTPRWTLNLGSTLYPNDLGYPVPFPFIPPPLVFLFFL